MNILSDIMGSKSQKIKELTEEVQELKEKLKNSQKTINKTNAYYKSILKKSTVKQ